MTRLVLPRVFTLGRFHATPWRTNPFDDPHGEWPPSPWRLVRAVTARWYQWAREQELEPSYWVSVHVPRREAKNRQFIGERRGYLVRLTFSVPVLGPLRLGHSSSLALGLFRPLEAWNRTA